MPFSGWRHAHSHAERWPVAAAIFICRWLSAADADAASFRHAAVFDGSFRRHAARRHAIFSAVSAFQATSRYWRRPKPHRLFMPTLRRFRWSPPPLRHFDDIDVTDCFILIILFIFACHFADAAI